MVWVLDEAASAADASRQVVLTDAGENSLAAWAKGLAEEEAQRMESCGLRVLTFIPRACSIVNLIGAEEGEAQPFNHAAFLTSFDFSKACSLRVSLQRHHLAFPVAAWCAICCLDVKPGLMVIVFPFVYKDEVNPLQHWALANTSGKTQYMVLRPRAASQAVGAQQAAPAHDHPDVVERVAPEVSSSVSELNSSQLCAASQPAELRLVGSPLFAGRTALLHAVLVRLPIARRTEVLRLQDPEICSRVWTNLQGLLVDASPTVQTIMDKLNEPGLDLLRSLEFIRIGHGQGIGPSSDMLLDVETFLALLERCCPKLLSKRRRRRPPTEWSSLLVPPARHLPRLQQRVAQLIEQRLWAILEEPALQSTVETATMDLMTKARGARRREKKTEQQLQLQHQQRQQQQQQTASATNAPVPLGLEIRCSAKITEAEEFESRSCKSTAIGSQERLSTNAVDVLNDSSESRSRLGSFESEPWLVPEDLGPSTLQLWRKAFVEAKSMQPSSLREEAALWRRFAFVVQRGIAISCSSTDPLAPLRGQLCITCQASFRPAHAQCYCIAPATDSVQSSPQSERLSSSSTSSEFDYAARLLNECFQFAGQGLCEELASRRDKSLLRPWRPINPCVGASADWRRCENLHWRLFWIAGRPQRRALAETEGNIWPNTPSSLGPDSDMYLGPDHSDLNVGHGNMLWHSMPFLPSQTLPLPCVVPSTLSQPPGLGTEHERHHSLLQKLAARNSELEERVAHLEQGMKKSHQETERDDSMKRLEERVRYLEDLLIRTTGASSCVDRSDEK